MHGSTIASLPDYLRVGFDCAQLAFYVLLPSGCGAKVVGLVMVEGEGLAVGFEESSSGGDSPACTSAAAVDEKTWD